MYVEDRGSLVSTAAVINGNMADTLTWSRQVLVQVRDYSCSLQVLLPFAASCIFFAILTTGLQLETIDRLWYKLEAWSLEDAVCSDVFTRKQQIKTRISLSPLHFNHYFVIYLLQVLQLHGSTIVITIPSLQTSRASWEVCTVKCSERESF